MNRAINKTATATLKSGSGVLHSAKLVAGVDAATAIYKSGGASGDVILVLGANAAGATDGHTFRDGVVFNGDLHVTITGTTPNATAEVS